MFQTFPEWKATCRINTGKKEEVTCPECKGEGEVLTECDCCGHENEINCELCDTKGTVIFGKLTPQDQLNCFSINDYHDSLGRDVKAYADWVGSPFGVVKFGFAIASDIRSFARGKCDIISLAHGQVVACI